MKNRSFVFLSFAILAAVVLYFGVQAYQYFTDPFTTTLAYASKSVEEIPMEGWIVRTEETLSTDAATLSHSLGEGSRVGAGQTVAIAYPSEDALETVKKIDEQELQLQQLEFALSTYLDSDAALKLDSSITDSILSLQGSLADGDYSAAADGVSALKAAILKRNHTYSSEEEIQASIDSVKAELASLQDSLTGARAINAEHPGTYSASCDGYETVLTPDILEGLTPSVLDGVASAETSANVGKLIYGSTWYYAANIPAEEADRLHVGQQASLLFAKGLSQDIPVTVKSISDEENGQKAVVLTCTEYLAQTTQLRHQQADLILASYTGIRVPSNALRMNEDGQGGVFCVVGMTARYKPVEVVYRGEGYTLIKPAASATGSVILRSGDEVIITAEDLKEGQVIQK